MRNRPAELSDLDRIMEIVDSARVFLRENGVDQWQNGYPTREIFQNDISGGNCFVCVENERILGVIAVYLTGERSYKDIFDGRWLTQDTDYGVFHRVAVDYESRGKGVARCLLSYAEQIVCSAGYLSIRGDTHRLNKPMRSLLETSGYTLCGTVILDESAGKDRARMCYEKVFEDL